MTTVHIPTSTAQITGDLHPPVSLSHGLLIFVHGSGSSRFSPRNQYLASKLRSLTGCGTLLLDLLTPSEEAIDVRTRQYRFDIPMLTNRVRDVCIYVNRELEGMKGVNVATFGASTGGAAAVWCTIPCEPGFNGGDMSFVKAAISRGGRVDLVPASDLRKVRVPTVLIVGGDDVEVLEMNWSAAKAIDHCVVEVVEGATHLFEEKGKLEEVADIAAKYITKYLVKPPKEE
ncbi:Alpha/Beta hydrolase protein [Gaertneriomyces semiglobifer]|nr:Alpha/Beta hydrolase protein [Gaertneriomyces semiglobifer]